MSRPELGQRLAEAIARESGCRDARLLSAFAAIPRGRFLGPPPWLIARAAYDGAEGATYVETSEQADVYTNVSVALDRSRHLFNGAPATVAVWLEALKPRRGERAFHAGCGTGYYTAILATLVGTVGSVIAADVDESLVERAGEALSEFANVSVIAGDAMTFAPPTFDVALAHMGVSVIPELWLTRLSPNGGRLVVPLTVPLPGRDSKLSRGPVFLIERSGDAYGARTIGGATIFTASGKTDEAAQRRLALKLLRLDLREVKSLRRDLHAPDHTCWLHEDRYCLSCR